MTWIMVDIEADGPCPADFSMVCFGAVVVEPGLSRTYYGGLIKPVSDKWIPEAIAVSGFTREQAQAGRAPADVMAEFVAWLKGLRGQPRFVSDNNCFDWQFVNWYLWHFTGGNPFGHSSTNLGSLYKGLVRQMSKNFKHLRKTGHDHNPLNDAIGNAEAMLQLKELGLAIKFD